MTGGCCIEHLVSLRSAKGLCKVKGQYQPHEERFFMSCPDALSLPTKESWSCDYASGRSMEAVCPSDVPGTSCNRIHRVLVQSP